MRHLLALPILLFLMVISMGGRSQTVTVTTDQDDYFPGEWVIITGSGWQNDSTVQLTLTHLDPLPDPLHTHESWLVQPNAEGYIYYEWFVEEQELGTSFDLTALGMTTGLTANTYFTDAQTRDYYPTAFTIFTGGATYCQGVKPADLVANWENTSCGNGAANYNTAVTITWYKNTSNSTSGGTSVQSKGTNTSTNTSSYTPSPTTLGTLYYYVVVSWGNGPNCATAGSITSGTQSVTVNPIPDTPTITAGGPTTFCVGGSVTLTSSAGTSYLWSPGGATTQSINITTGGNYTVQLTNANGCLSAPSAPTTVTVNSLPTTPTISASGPTTFCTGESVTLTSSLGSSYLWSTGETTQSINVNTSGNYNVRVTNANGCQSASSANTTVTVNPIPPKPTITADGGITTVCDGGSVVLSSSSASGNQWYRNGSLILGAVNRTFSATTSGSYTVVVTTSGCPSPVSDAINVTVNPRPTGLLSGTQTICNGNSATLSIAVSGTGPWSGTLTGGIPFTGSSSPITVNVSPATTTTYSIISLSDAKCTAIAGDLSGNVTVTVRPIPTASITITGNSTICSGLTTTIKISGPANGTVIYNINGGSDITGTINNGGNLNLTTANLTGNTTYNLVSAAYGDAPGCSNSVSGSVTITVNQPPVITTQPVNQTVTYGGSASFTVASTGIPTPTYQWQVNSGLGFTNIPGATSTTLDVENPTVAMNGYKYRVIVNNICSTVNSNEVSLTVNARPVTITADAKSKTYGNADPALSYQITSGTLAFTDAFTGSLTRDAGENVGSYAITQGTVALNSNYALTYVGANLTIDKRAVSITADAKTKVYGNADPALTYQITNGTLAFTDAFTGSLTRDAGENVGNYAITQGTVALSNNYTLTYIGANLSVTSRPVTITADAKSKVYGNADPALTYQITNGTLAFTDAFTGSLTREVGEDVGAYEIGQGTVALSSNYTISYLPADLTITARPVSITADAKTKVYGNADPALTYQITNGTLVFTDDFTGSLTREVGEDVGAYEIGQGTVALSSNYTLSYIPADLTITARPVTITVDAKTKVYGNADPALTYQITNGTLAFTDVFTGALSRAAGEDVGSYEIGQGTVALSSNYTLSYLPADLTITARPVSITADAKTKVYGNADPALTYQITSGTLAFTDAFTGSLTREVGEDVGAYEIGQGTVALSSNYTLSYLPADLTITARPVTITADAKTKVYGNADPALTYQITNGTLAFTDDFTGALSRAAGEDVGSYEIGQGTVALSSNYTISYLPADLTITARPVTITADAKTKVYGNADPALTYQITNGTLAFTDDFTGALSRAAGEDVGSYEIGQGTVALSSNYTLSYLPADLTITARPVTITADAKTKVYGNADPALTYQITSGTLAFTDAFTGSLTREVGEDVGAYEIGQGTVALSSNYNLSYVPADLTITARPVTITADAKTKVYGNADPALTYQITNGTLAFTDAFTGALSRAAGEDVGSYAITQGNVTLSTNYTLTYIGANLSITSRPVTITADAKSKTYGNADPALTYQITSGTLAFTDAFTGALSRAAGENVGSYAITQGTVALNGNYTLTYVGTNLIINKRLVTITADVKSKYIGQVDPALTYQITSGSLVTGDAFTGSLSRAVGECAGTYAISQNSVALNSNYTLSYVGANFTINGVSIDASQSSTPVPMGSTATLSAKVTPVAQGITVIFTLDNGTTATFPTYTGITDIYGCAKATVSGLPVEVYKVTALIGSCATSTAAYLAVYDPTGGFVTGGGWITSPAGAYSANLNLTGKANFGFNSKYKKGSNVPEGNTEFQFQTGNLNFSSSTYSLGSLVIAGAKATYKGVGTINGSGNYAFMVSAVDGDVTGGGGIDKFRIKIWDANKVIYDNNMGVDENDLPTTALGGGSIVIHSADNKNKIAEILPDESANAFEATLKVYPNPFTEKLNIEFSYATDTKARLDIYSITGAKLETLYDGPVSGGQLYSFEYLPRLVSSQVVFYHLTLDGKTQVGKVLFNERR